MSTAEDEDVFYHKLQVTVAAEIPFLIREAATQAGFRHASLWVRDRLARLLAEELGEDYDEIMANMPTPWEKNPGGVILDGAHKAGV